ncbi:HEPN domain protein [Candidatus Magnetomorum sp. HK-1]|nr:HEPN domain protein [Candidatus Magnetomorum sp. HK-1]
MNNPHIASEWFSIAEMDISSAKYLLNMHPTPIEIICYHCQQSSEKYLKGFLVLNGHEIIKTHDLVFLNQLCSSYDNEFTTIQEECLRLTDYGVNIRYPYPIDLNVADMKLAIKDAEIIQNFVSEKANQNMSNRD